MVRTISDEDIEDLRYAFELIDRDKTGLITVENLRKAMEINGYCLAHEELDSKP